MMYPFYSTYSAAFTPFHSFMMLFFWGVIIVGTIVLVRWLIQETRTNNQNGDSTALEILKTRYAKGEINKEEFEAKKKDLQS